jgi:hypothetical protein
MRRAAKVDANQPAIIFALRSIGARVMPTHAVGQGFPDLVVSFRGRNILIEIKDGSKPPSARRLTPDQKIFHEGWDGELYVVESAEEAVRVLTGDGGKHGRQQETAQSIPAESRTQRHSNDAL